MAKRSLCLYTYLRACGIPCPRNWKKYAIVNHAKIPRKNNYYWWQNILNAFTSWVIFEPFSNSWFLANVPHHIQFLICKKIYLTKLFVHSNKNYVLMSLKRNQIMNDDKRNNANRILSLIKYEILILFLWRWYCHIFGM